MNENSAQQLLAIAKRFEKKQNFKQAEEVLLKLLTLYPQNRTASQRLGEIQEQSAHAGQLFLSKTQREKLSRIANVKGYRAALPEFMLLLQRYPKDTFLTNSIAEFFVKSKNWEGAFKYYKTTVKNDSKNTDALYNLAILYVMLGDTNKAIKLYLKVLSLDKKNKESCNNLAAIMMGNGDLVSAEKYYLKALAIDPDYHDVNNNYAMLLNQTKRYAEAVKYCKKAVKQAPDNATYAYNLCDLLEKQNRLEDLKDALVNIKFNLNVDEPKIAYQIGKYEARVKNYKEAVKILDCIKPDALPIVIEGMRQGILGKCHDVLGNTQKAYRSFDVSNLIAKENYQGTIHDPNKYLAEIEKNIEVLSSKSLGEFDIQSSLETQYETPVFLIGFPRSGTTLLDTILRSHPGIEVVEEQQMVAHAIKKSGKNLEDILNGCLSTSDQEIMRNAYFTELGKHAVISSKMTIIDKLPLNMVNLVFIKAIFPDAKFLFSLRHPYDCVLSCFMQNFKLNEAMLNFLSIDDAAQLYNQAMHLWKKSHDYINSDTCFVKYEDLIADFDREINKCLSFLELDWHEKLRDYRKTALERGRIHTPSYNQVTQEIYKNAINRWELYEAHMRHLEPLLKPWVEYWEYD